MIERIEINLLPSEYRLRPRGIAIPRTVIYPAVVILILAVCAAGITIWQGEEISNLNGEIAAINAEIEANKGLQKELNELRQNKTVTEGKIAALKQISVDREKWVRLLEMLSDALPVYTWLMSVRNDTPEGQPERLLIEARTYSFPEVAHYMSRLEGHELIDHVALEGVEQIQGQDRRLYRFNLACALVAAAPVAPETPNAAGEPGRRGRRGR
ncbi:MAG: PilN domain-containing protein [Chitinispirillia bacterium]|nr:PilN domain-containing protein [Chitinispirillia bacterium]MCL2241713.1 PilN domain-containing protein [Chitinispirillia bacterium]